VRDSYRKEEKKDIEGKGKRKRKKLKRHKEEMR